jgi:DNA-binding transcriptional ArsR family regulator
MVTKAAQASPVLDALGHQTRREILALLKAGPLPVGDIAKHLPISRPAVSKHLRILEQAELVEHVSQGTQNIFRLRLSGFSAARAYLESFWDEALASFQHLAERAEEAEQ